MAFLVGAFLVMSVVAGVLMVFLILLQEPKSGGLALLGGTGLDRSLGVSNPLRKATVYMAIIFMFCALSLASYNTYTRAENKIKVVADEPLPAAATTTTPAGTPLPPTEKLFQVKLIEAGPNVTEVAKVVGEITSNQASPQKTVEIMASKLITVAPKTKAEEYQKQLEAVGAKVELVEQAPTAPATGPSSALPPAEPLYEVKLLDAGPNADKYGATFTEIMKGKTPEEIDAATKSKVLATVPQAKAEEIQKTLEAAGAKVQLVKKELPPATAPAAPSTPTAPTTPATPVTPTTPAAPAPTAPAPTTPAPAPAQPKP